MARGKRKSRDDLDELSRLFLDLRERAGLIQPDAARRAGITQSKLSRAETGRGVPDVDTARRLARIYKATPDEQKRLIELVTVMKPARLDSRLIMQRGTNLRFQARVAQIEQSSALVRAYQPHMILGALQTPPTRSRCSPPTMHGPAGPRTLIRPQIWPPSVPPATDNSPTSSTASGRWS